MSVSDLKKGRIVVVKQRNYKFEDSGEKTQFSRLNTHNIFLISSLSFYTHSLFEYP